MEAVKVFSPIEDKEIRKNLNDSPIWKQAYHEEELSRVDKKYATMFEYTIKFEGLKPVMVNGVKKIK
jgi:hypothetical protein